MDYITTIMYAIQNGDNGWKVAAGLGALLFLIVLWAAKRQAGKY